MGFLFAYICGGHNFGAPLKARIHCEIFLSDSFMKHSLMYISLHLIWFHEIQIKYVKRKTPRLRKKEFKKSLGPATLLKKRLWRSCFRVNFVKFLKTPFLQNTSGWVLPLFSMMALEVWFEVFSEIMFFVPFQVFLRSLFSLKNLVK